MNIFYCIAIFTKIITSGPFDLSCNTQHIVTLPDKKIFVTKLVTESQPMDEFVSGSRWAEKTLAYKWIKDEYAIATGDQVLEDFYLNAQTGCFGKIDSIDVLMSNGDYLSAQIINNSQNPQSQTEQNHKQFIEIAAGYFANDTIAAVDSIVLFEIAIQCPLDGGYSVYASRALINYVYKKNLWFDDYCKSEIRGSFIDNVRAGKNGIIIYPNPNNGDFTVYSESTLEYGVVIEITDITGKLIYSNKIKNSTNSFSVNVNGIECGVYFIKIIRSDSETNISKFVISK